LLDHVVGLAPGFLPARRDRAFALYRQSHNAAALADIGFVLAQSPNDAPARELKASLLLQSGEYDAGITLYQAMLTERPYRPKLWISLGDAFKTVGRSDAAVDAYRQSLAHDPDGGAAWWALANLKTFRFDAADIAAMRRGVADGDLDEEQRLHFEFALGKAAEDAGDDAAAFALYTAANARRRRLVPHDPEALSVIAARSEALFTPAFFAGRPGGHPSPEPIFVVGMPRSGSTLVEQILASHPLIEGTRELPYLPAIARGLIGPDGDYPDMIGALDPARQHALGEQYLARAGVHRKTGRPFFIDKLPNNFMHIGLIRLILPNARVIDVRRHPMATGFACFKQHFAHGQEFAYDLTDLGRYYADYVRITAAFDRAVPGHMHRVSYERLVVETEAEVRATLGYLRLPFDPACLRFHETARAVRTPSAEQVRKPIFTEAVEHWRRFEAELASLKAALGPALVPDPPDHS
jgi:tetratricopeptide (TPR) repeat protein